MTTSRLLRCRAIGANSRSWCAPRCSYRRLRSVPARCALKGYSCPRWSSWLAPGRWRRGTGAGRRRFARSRGFAFSFWKARLGAPRIVDSDPSMYWLGLMTAVGLAQSNVYLQMKNRRALAQNLADRVRSHQKLTDSEEKFRQIFQQSGDIVAVTNLDTSAILKVNTQFVVRSRVPRELVVGRREIDFNFFAEPAAREDFMRELLDSGVVKNLEVRLNGFGYDRPIAALIAALVVRLR